MANTEQTPKIKKPATARVTTPRIKKVVAVNKTDSLVVAKEANKEEKKSATGFLRAVGRRKEASARVRMTDTGNGSITINGRPFEKYFPLQLMRELIIAPLKLVGQFDNHDFSIKVEGGGTRGQSEAVIHGFGRVLLKWNPEFRPALKKAGFLKRDPRAKERKKFGLKGARRAPQWAKR